MAREYKRYTDMGAQIVAVSVDAPGRNAAMVESLALPFPVLTDEAGQSLAKPLELWQESREVAIPAILLVAPSGELVWEFRSRDYADRPQDDEDLLGAVKALGLAPIETAPPNPGALEPGELFDFDWLYPYFRGIYKNMEALVMRIADDHARAEIERIHGMTGRYLEAVKATHKLRKQG